MKILVHQNSCLPLRVISFPFEEVKLQNTTCTGALWELANRYPSELICWCEESLEKEIVFKDWEKVFYHELIMASFAVNTIFLPNSIGYVDQLPFVNVRRDVKYPTWLMSSDIGGITGNVLLQFQDLFGKITDMGLLLNSVAKIGQQNGLFCYSDPGLVNANVRGKAVALASSGQLFSFVSQQYTSSWTTVLLYCLKKFEKKFPFGAYLKSFFKEKMFRSAVDLSSFVPAYPESKTVNTIDVIIPTLARKTYLLQVMEDLKAQTLPPVNVIIVEQDPGEGSQSQLTDILTGEWPFKIIHIFTHQTGVCNARNLALEEVVSEWIFFADDDIRLKPSLLDKVIVEASRYRISALNLNCRQPGEETVFHKVKQWGSFGAGTSVVKTSYAKKCRFLEVFEFGYGEDADFGMQLRKIGCDIIYHPALQILHLKAPTGGFRKKPRIPWEQEGILPKPSPTLMAYMFKHYTPHQIKGYKVSLFLKFYNKQPIKNPFAYLQQMRKRWALSETWAEKLLANNKTMNKPEHST